MDLAGTSRRLLAGSAVEIAGAAAAVALLVSGMLLGAWAMQDFGEPAPSVLMSATAGGLCETVRGCAGDPADGAAKEKVVR